MSFYTVSKYKTKEQIKSGLSFCGGRPLMPHALEWPECKDCRRPLTFFFQLQLPSESPLGSKILAVFFCVECASEQTSKPQLETRPVLGRGSARPAEEVLNPNLRDYQINFRAILFDADDSLTFRNDLPPRVRFSEYRLRPRPEFSPAHMIAYGEPPHEPDPDDTAFVYRGSEATKVLYIPRGYTFPKTPDAPRQRMPPMGDEPRFRDEDDYLLFSGYKRTVLAALVEGSLEPFIV